MGVSVAARAARQSLTWQVSPDLLGALNSKGYFETSNPAWMTVLGWTEAEVASMSIFELLHPDDVERTRKGFDLTQQGQPAIQFPNRYRRKDGTYRWISWVGVPEEGMVCCSGRDITTEVEQAEQLAAVRRERDTAWALSQDLLVVVTLDGTFTAVNTAWTTLLGWTQDELLGRGFPELTHPDDLANTLVVFATISQARLTTPYEYRLRHKDGSYRWFAWTAALAGEAIYGNGRNTTAAREHAAALRAAEDALQDSLAFLSGTGAVARAMREADWSASALGHPGQWPQSLRSVVNLLIGSAFPMFVCWGPQLATLYNDAYAEILGEKHPVALGKPLLETWSEISADIEPLVARALAGESTFLENLPLRMRRHGFDEDTWFTFSYSPVLGEDGRTAGMYCACVETTRSVLAQQQLQARQEWLQSLFHQAPGFTAVLHGPGHRFDMVNQAYLDITGNRPLLGQTVAQALPEAFAQLGDLLNGVYATGEPFVGRAVPVTVNQGEGKAPYDAIVDFMCQPLLNAQGRVEGIFVQGHDVTEQHRAQQALLAFSDSIPAIAWVATPDGLLERFNGQWYDYTGTSHEQAVGQGWVKCVHPDDLPAARAAWEGARGGIEAWQVEYRLQRQDGVYRWFLARAVSQLDPSGAVARWFGTTTDIEDARQAAQSLRDADRQKDEFLATLAHELRNPLAPIRTAVHLLEAPKANDQIRSRAAEIIGRQVGQMSRLLDDLIDVARITQRKLVLKKEWVSVTSVVEAAMEAARPLAEAKRHHLVAVLDDPAALMMVDSVRLAQVLINLLNNAAKYTDAGGSIRLEVRSEDDELCLTVTDNGIGLTPLAMEHVFTMFSQEQSAIERSEGGLGIGLALAKGLVRLHGGSLSVHSDGEGQGSCFTVRLPIGAAVEATAPAASGHSFLPSPARKVLLADDNQDSADMLADFLRLSGHVVHIAHDGARAADLAVQLQPDVLILDIGMPGMTGYEVARHVRSQSWGSRPLLIAATGWGQDEDRQKALIAGFDLHLTKPFDPAELVALIAARAHQVSPPQTSQAD